jgi:uncharacterized protein YdaL
MKYRVRFTIGLTLMAAFFLFNGITLFQPAQGQAQDKDSAKVLTDLKKQVDELSKKVDDQKKQLDSLKGDLTTAVQRISGHDQRLGTYDATFQRYNTVTLVEIDKAIINLDTRLKRHGW